MKKVFSKFISIVLVIVFVFGAIPLSGFVGIELPEFNLFGTKAEASEISGYYTYTVYNGEATISNVSTSISGSVTIPATLGGYSVTGIGDNAFNGCTGLTSINIPDSVTSIGSCAFWNCTGLASATIPDSVTSIGDHAFYKCTDLKNVTIGNSVTSIGNYVFNYTGLYNDSSNWKNGVLYIGNYLIEAKTTVSGAYTIKTGTKVLADNAFEFCTGLTSVTIPNSLTRIGGWSFNDCTGLTNIIIPDGVTSIGDEAFNNTGLYNDSSNWEDEVLYISNHLIKANTVISGEYIIKSGTKTIADNAFRNCASLTSITIPDSLISIGDGAFYRCTVLTSVTIPDYVKSIGNYVFFDCTKLISVTIPDSVTRIGDSAFSGCTELTSVMIPDSVTSIGDYVFNYCTRLKSITIPDSVTSIGYRTFYDCTSLTSVTIPDSVTSIGNYAFYNCTGLKSVTIGNSVTSIGKYVFSGCTRLTSVTIPDGVTSIGYMAFQGCTGLTSVTIPDSVTNIDESAFENCSNIITTYYTGTPEQWNNISIGSYNGAISKNIVFEYDSERPYYGKGTCGDNLTWILNTDGELVIDGTGDMSDYRSDSDVPWYSKRSIIKSVTICDEVTSIGDFAFYGCNNLSTTYYAGTPEQWSYISIGSNNEAISKYYVFECNSERPYGKGNCGDNLTWILYTDGELIIDGTGDMTDYRSDSNVPWNSKRSTINSVTIPNGVTSIGDNAFFGCTGLTSLTVSENVSQIGNSAFAGCNNLKKIDFLGYSTSIADDSFKNSPNVVFYCKSGSSVQSFAERNSLMYVLTDGEYSGVIIKNNQLVSYQGDSASPKISSGITSIGSNAFKDNSTVKTVELPNSVSSIYSGAFSNCTSLERIVVPHTVTTIAPDAFSGTNATIVCYANSYAHQYAVEKGMKFELISVTLNQTKVILSVGEYSIITATPEQEYLNSLQISWKSSNPSVAAVDENGKVSALSQGTATIYAFAPTGKALATCSVQVGYSFCVTIQNPSTKTISYKSGIILHATADNLPSGAKIVWEKDNDNFSMSDDGNGNCTIVSKANGSTTFTAKVKLADGSIAKDSNGNEISAQVTMNSKAGFFDKIVAFFKGLFGGNKVLPQLFKGIF